MQWLPNLLTLGRIVMTPWVIWEILVGNCRLAMPLALIAGASDALDGYFARRFGAVTRFGAWLDPIADKALLIAIYISFGVAGLVPGWLVWLVVGRDLLIVGIAAAALTFTSVRDFPPSVLGKLSTVVQISVVLLILAACNGSEAATRLKFAGISAVAVTAVWSGLHYAWRAVLRLRSATEKV